MNRVEEGAARKRRKISHDSAESSSSFVDVEAKADHKKLASKQNEVANTSQQLIRCRHATNEQDSCPICLQDIDGLSLTFPCHHAYDFACIKRWLEQSRNCPLCKTAVEFLIYDIQGSNYKRFVPTEKDVIVKKRETWASRARRHRQEEQYRRFGRRHRGDRSVMVAQSDLEAQASIALERRKFVYANKLMSFHVGTNTFSRFSSFSVRDLQGNSECAVRLRAKATTFTRRELTVFPFLADENVEFVLRYIIDGVLTRLEIQSAGAHRLVSEFLGEDNTAIFLHELRTYLRSPFEDLSGFDGRRNDLVQYGVELEPAWPLDDK